MRVKLVLSLTLLIVMAAAAPARANIFDIIWEMSGPQLFGFGAQCEFGRRPTRCLATVRRDAEKDRQPPKTWLIVEPSLYLATGKGEWEVGSVVMAAVDPMIAVALKPDRDRHRFYTAAGASFNYFVGASVEDFGRVAFKIRPLTYEYHVENRERALKRVLVSWTFR